MEAMLAMNLLSMGSHVVSNVIDTCASAVSSATSASSSLSFDNILKSEVTSATSKYAAMDATSLANESTALRKNLCECDDVKAFIGNNKSFKISKSGDGYVIERGDGKLWRIPGDSKTAAIARDYCDCSVAQERLNGNPISGMRSEWNVTVEA